MKILVSGFEAFHTNDENPTQEVIKHLPSFIEGHEILGVTLPVLYDVAFDLLKESIVEFKPDIIISLGLAQGRKYITPERIAVNIDDASIPDNNGVKRQGNKIEQNGRNAYFSTIDVLKISNHLKEKNIPSIVSNSAGAYICNHIMYRTLYYIEQNNLPIRSGFIHVPLMDKQNHSKEVFSLPFNQILNAIKEAIIASI